MIAEAIQKITELALDNAKDAQTTESLSVFDPEGKPASYVFRREIQSTGGYALGDVIKPFYPPTLNVSTLTGFVDAVRSGICGEATGKIIHVEDYLTVSLRNLRADAYGERVTWLRAKHEPNNSFQFDKYYEDPQRFIIALQVSFLATDDLLYVIKLASNLRAGNSIETSDNGINQTATIKRGEVGVAEVQIKPRVKLIPLRSFSEANESTPVMEEFLLRFKQGDAEQPSVALFSVDGNKYKGEIMRSIKDHLGKQITDIPILA